MEKQQGSQEETNLLTNGDFSDELNGWGKWPNTAAYVERPFFVLDDFSYGVVLSDLQSLADF